MSKKLLIIIIVLGVLLLAAMGGTLFLVYTKLTPQGGGEEGEEVKKSVKVEEEEGKKGKEEKKGKEKAAPKPLLRLDTFIVNLADQDSSRYLRTTIELELMDEVTQQELEKRMAPVRDAILGVLPTKKVQDIITAEGKQALKNQLLDAINKVLTKGKVINLYYTEFVIQ
jgi:flagellar FliL protein